MPPVIKPDPEILDRTWKQTAEDGISRCDKAKKFQAVIAPCTTVGVKVIPGLSSLRDIFAILRRGTSAWGDF